MQTEQVKKEIEYNILKYHNKNRITKNLVIDFIEMLQDYNRDAEKYIVYFEEKFKEKY